MTMKIEQPFYRQQSFFIQAIYWIITFVVWFFFLNTFSRYHFFYLEQAQLFTGDINISLSGWLSTYLTGCYVQHFGLPFVGPLLLAFLNTLIAGTVYFTLSHLGAKINGMIWSQLIPVLLTFMFFNHLYDLSGTTAFFLATLALSGTIIIKPFAARLIIATIFAPILHWLVGPAALLYAIAIVLFQLFQEKGWKRFVFLLPIVTAAGAAYYATILGMTDSMTFSFLPNEYFHHKMRPQNVIYYSWFALWMLIVVYGWFGSHCIKSGKLRLLSYATSLFLVAAITWRGSLRYDDANSRLLKMITYYSLQDNWQQVFELTKDNHSNYLYIAYRNLALSHLGRLADDLFQYPQSGALCLFPMWDQSLTTSQLLSDIYYHIGDIALAQEMAFEGNTAQGNGGSPHLWKRLVDTNLIFNFPKVALKYIDLLAKTPHYQKWAESRRELALHPEQICNNPELASKRCFFGGEQHLRHFFGIDYDFRLIAEHCPENPVAIEYLGCLYLLGKELNGFQSVLDKFYGTEVLPELPKSFQQAVIILNEHQPEKWKDYKLSSETVKQFQAFRETFNRNRQSPYLRETMLRTFGNTYWYYFTFKK